MAYIRLTVYNVLVWPARLLELIQQFFITLLPVLRVPGVRVVLVHYLDLQKVKQCYNIILLAYVKARNKTRIRAVWVIEEVIVDGDRTGVGGD